LHQEHQDPDYWTTLPFDLPLPNEWLQLRDLSRLYGLSAMACRVREYYTFHGIELTRQPVCQASSGDECG
jgi:hypothetical protein